MCPVSLFFFCKIAYMWGGKVYDIRKRMNLSYNVNLTAVIVFSTFPCSPPFSGWREQRL